MPGQVKSVQNVVRSGQVCSGPVRSSSSQVRPGQATVRSKSCKVMPGQDGSGHVKFMSGQLKSGRSSQVSLGQNISVQVRSEQGQVM